MRVAPLDAVRVAPLDVEVPPPPPPSPPPLVSPWRWRLGALLVGAALSGNAVVLAFADFEACLPHGRRLWAFHACTLAVWAGMLPALCFGAEGVGGVGCVGLAAASTRVDTKPSPARVAAVREAVREAVLGALGVLLALVGGGVQAWAVAQLWVADPSWHGDCRFFGACHGACHGAACHGAACHGAACHGAACHGAACHGAAAWASCHEACHHHARPGARPWPYAASCAVYRCTSALLVGALVAAGVALAPALAPARARRSAT
jgi:hypothetical protein